MKITQDIELQKILKKEEDRQKNTITLIASENYVFPEVYRTSGSVLTNKYAEGRVGARYYGGTMYIDEMEILCQKRALKAFGVDEKEWGVAVQPYSGSIANLSAYAALTKPGGKIMGMNLPAGGHLTHGFQTPTKKISASSLFFSSHPYSVDAEGRMDYQEIEKEFQKVQPDILICGYSAHSQDIDYKRLREIAGDKAFLYADISHISALIVGGAMNNPFTYCDVVMTTTHKGLRGPRGAMIFYRKSVAVRGVSHNLDAAIHSSVFPLVQGGPHNHTISGIANAMHMVSLPEFKEYTKQVIKNAQRMQKKFTSLGYSIVTGSTVNHMMIIDLRNMGVGGSQVESVCDLLGISINKNTVPGDTSPFNPSGIRVGTYAITTRGFNEEETEELVSIIDYAVCVAKSYKESQKPLAKDQTSSLLDWIETSKIMLSEEALKAKNKIAYLTNTHPIPTGYISFSE
ncbi:glycine hydroxymethyltransferase [Nematocida sp. LUAm3]|nr:glycine hydroxymethyltransferase [Nematocida sp. LUAm3]KAI5174924.1 glycine hydroxymethyltransferase [Nematocida sp. LUAm2]KAI5177477.1 glycine hydroxymethyltransferase [Nematocida sp. LUAm1]